MTPKRVSIAAGGVALLVLLVVGLLQLAGSSRDADGALEAHPRQMRARLAGSPAPLAALHAQADELLAGGLAAVAGAPCSAARLPGGDQQVGLLVRALPGGVRRLSARLGRAGS